MRAWVGVCVFGEDGGSILVAGSSRSAFALSIHNSTLTPIITAIVNGASCKMMSWKLVLNMYTVSMIDTFPNNKASGIA